jgi:hypothetical protein
MGRIPKSVQAKGEPDLTAWTMIQTPKETIPAEIRYARALSTPVPFQGSSQLRPEGGRTPPRPNERGSQLRRPCLSGGAFESRSAAPQSDDTAPAPSAFIAWAVFSRPWRSRWLRSGAGAITDMA